jgi:hypothetical protein
MIALVCTTVLPAGIVSPNASINALSPRDRKMPAKMPTTDASRPTSTDSNSTLLTTCRRLAPIARSSAISRVRCCTMIEKVLKIRNAPTMRAMIANTSRNVLKMLRTELRLFWLSLVIASPVTTCTFGFESVGSTSRIRRARAACDSPLVERATMSVTVPG